MEHIDDLLNAPLLEIEDRIIKNIQVAMQYPHQLKLAAALCLLAEQSTKALKNIDTTDFYDNIKKRINDVEKECNDFNRQHGEHLKQNGKIAEQVGTSTNELKKLKQNIEDTLGKYDQLLKELIEKRDELPIEKV